MYVNQLAGQETNYWSGTLQSREIHMSRQTISVNSAHGKEIQQENRKGMERLCQT